MKPDRERYLRGVEQGTAAWPDLAAGVREVREWADREGDPVDGMFAFFESSLKDALRDSGNRFVRDPSSLLVRTTLDNDVLAEMAPFADGSGLVLISEGMVSLVGHLAKIAAKNLQPSKAQTLRGQVSLGLRTWRESRSERQSDLSRTCAGLLRFYFLHQRVMGLSAKLDLRIPEADRDHVDLMCLAALTFLVAHEMGHFVMGHQPGSPSAREDEFDADAFALDLVAAGTGLSGSVGRIGALLAFACVDATEQATFIRTAVTHPRPSERWEQLVSGHPSWRTSGDLLYLQSVFGAIDQAADLTRSMPDCWPLLMTSSDVVRSGRPNEYYDGIARLDEVNSLDLDSQFAFLENLRSDGVVDIVDQVELTRTLGTDAALEALGVSRRSRSAIADPRQALAFHSLFHAVWSSRPLADIDPTLRRLAANSAALLMAPSVPTVAT